MSGEYKDTGRRVEYLRRHKGWTTDKGSKAVGGRWMGIESVTGRARLTMVAKRKARTTIHDDAEEELMVVKMKANRRAEMTDEMRDRRAAELEFQLSEEEYAASRTVRMFDLLDDFTYLPMSHKQAAKQRVPIFQQLDPYMSRWKHMSLRAVQHQSAQAYVEIWERIEKLMPLQHLNWLADQFAA